MLGCEGDGNAGVGSGGGVVVVSVYMGGTCGSGGLPSAGDVLDLIIIGSSNLCLPSLHAFFCYIVETVEVIP